MIGRTVLLSTLLLFTIAVFAQNPQLRNRVDDLAIRGKLLFASGRYVDRIVLSEEPQYEERVVICDSRRFDTLLAIPL